jgi:hypothetical protein
MPLPVPDGPNQRVHVDLLGPLKSTGANKYILGITDAFTKVGVLVALPDKEANTVAKAILHRWIYRFSAPVQIHSDQGKEFCNQVLDELLRMIGTKHTTTAAYHPQANAQVERLNRTILNFFRGTIQEDSTNWEGLLPAFEFHYNSSFHSTIGMAPFELLYGIRPGQQGQRFESHQQRWEFLKELEEQAKHNSIKAKVIQKNAHDSKASDHAFQIGQQVLIKVHSHLNKNHKFAAQWEGPGIIKDIQAHKAWVLYKGKTKTFNLHNIKPLTVGAKELELQGEESHPAKHPAKATKGKPDAEEAESNPSAINYANCNQTDQLQAREAKAKHILEVIGVNQREIDPYLTELHLRILRSQPTDPPALTPLERVIYDAIPACERNLRTAGSPVDIPEFRYNLMRMPGLTKPAPNAPPAAPAPPPPPAPMAGPGMPIPAAPVPRAPRTASRNTRMGKRAITPSDRRLRSAGPAQDHGPLPKRVTTRPQTPAKAKPAPVPEDQSLLGKVSRLGWALLTGGRNDESDSGNVSQVNPVPDNPGEPGDLEDEWSFS